MYFYISREHCEGVEVHDGVGCSHLTLGGDIASHRSINAKALYSIIGFDRHDTIFHQCGAII